MKNLKKTVLITSLALVVASVGSGFSVPKAHAALATGSLVKGPNSDAVYYISGSVKRVFPDTKTYFTWYGSFAPIQTVTIAELDLYTTGNPVPYRPGTKLVTHPNTERVYAVESNTTLRWIPSEAVARNLYGMFWADRVNDVHELTFGNYRIGTQVTADTYPEGTLLQGNNETTVYYYDGVEIRPFASNAVLLANNFDSKFIVKVASLSRYTIGSPITSAESFASIGGIAVGGPSETLTARIASTNPATNSLLVAGAVRVPMLAIELVTDEAAVVVDSITIERRGSASDSVFASFELLEGASLMPITGQRVTLNANHKATFTDDFTVLANKTKTVVVAANLAANLEAHVNEYPSVAVISITLKGGAVLIVNLPLNGNNMLVRAL